MCIYIYTYIYIYTLKCRLCRYHYSICWSKHADRPMVWDFSYYTIFYDILGCILRSFKPFQIPHFCLHLRCPSLPLCLAEARFDQGLLPLGVEAQNPLRRRLYTGFGLWDLTSRGGTMGIKHQPQWGDNQQYFGKLWVIKKYDIMMGIAVLVI